MVSEKEKFGEFVRRERKAKEIGLRRNGQDDWRQSNLPVQDSAETSSRRRPRTR